MCVCGSVNTVTQGSETTQNWFPVLTIMLDGYVTSDKSNLHI